MKTSTFNEQNVEFIRSQMHEALPAPRPGLWSAMSDCKFTQTAFYVEEDPVQHQIAGDTFKRWCIGRTGVGLRRPATLFFVV